MADSRPSATDWAAEAHALAVQLSTPPAGWFVFGTHVDSDVPLEFWGEDGGGLPLWERPVQPADAVTDERWPRRVVLADAERAQLADVILDAADGWLTDGGRGDGPHVRAANAVADWFGRLPARSDTQR